MRSSVLALAFCLALPDAAAAQSVADTIGAWGLLGTWALDCTRPASQSGSLLTYAIRQGEAVHLRDFGDTQDENEILSAKRAADGSIELRVRFPHIDQTRDFALMKGPDGRIRSKFNRGPDGSYTIRDGAFVANGARTPWQSRCY